MPVQTTFGRFVAALVENEFAAAPGVRLLEIDEPAGASYIKSISKLVSVVSRSRSSRNDMKLKPQSEMLCSVISHLAVASAKQRFVS
jgi:hypothetical protein